MEEALLALLVGDATIAGLVSTRIYWNTVPQNATDPIVVLYKISGGPEYTYGGANDLEASRVQIDVRAKTYSSGIGVARAIKSKLSGFSGTQTGISFRGIFLLSERQRAEKPGSSLLHTFSLDFDVNFKPS